MASSAPTSHFISVLGVRVHYNLAIPNQSTYSDHHGTIVLIHGFLCSTFTWNKCLQPLADVTGYRVLAYDRLGFGFTERVLDGERYTRKNEELLALELLTQLNITNNIHLVSSSSGAVIAFDMAIARPDLIRSIIFVAPYGLVDNQHSPGSISRFLIGTKPIQMLLKFGLTHFLPFKNAYYNQDIAKDVLTREGYLKPIRDDPLFLKTFVLFTQHYDASSSNTAWNQLDNTQKILIIIGENDKIVPNENIQKFYQQLKENRPSGSITESSTISQCGHLPQEERVDELITLIHQFLKDQSTP
jgi:pimeloyl-ACP methyl ester carboxylesterase